MLTKDAEPVPARILPTSPSGWGFTELIARYESELKRVERSRN
jgi:hypothetical protein